MTDLNDHNLAPVFLQLQDLHYSSVNFFRGVAKDLVKCCEGASLARLTTAGIATRTSKPFELKATAGQKHKN